MSGRASVALGVVLLSLFAAGCPNKAKSEGARAARCVKFGDTCEVSAGKLGTCVRRDDCTGGDCFTCQSQH